MAVTLGRVLTAGDGLFLLTGDVARAKRISPAH